MKNNQINIEKVKGVMMKKLLPIAVLFTIFFVGCSNQESTLTGLDENELSNSPKKTKVTSMLELESVRTPQSILPTKLVSITMNINGLIGGVLNINQDVYNTERNIVHVNANFSMPAGAFVGIQNITMTIDADNGSISFFPHMTFLHSCKLDFEVQNVNLTSLGFTSEDRLVQFVYFSDSGSIEPIESLESKIDFSSGFLKTKQAKIDHFSRYGFFRKDCE